MADSGEPDGGTGPFEVALEVDFSKIAVQEIGKVLGYVDTPLPEHFGELIAGTLSDLQRRCSVRAGYRIATVRRPDSRKVGLYIGDTRFTPGPVIISQLHDAEEAALFVCTIGPQMEETAATLFGEGDPVKGHFTDTVASVAVERVADALHDTIELQMRERGLAVTNRFSPGYCGWPLSQQQELFSFFPDGFCGVILTESALMLPKKSVSGIIGIGPDVTREPYFCDRCNDTGCTYKQFLNSRKHTKDDQHD